MRKAEIFFHHQPVGVLEELEHGYRFSYRSDYLKNPKAESKQDSEASLPPWDGREG